jgi:hypothetical protein
VGILDDFPGTERQCDICGRRYIFPQEFRKGPNDWWYCRASCAADIGNTGFEQNQRRVAAAGQIKEPNAPPGARPLQYDDLYYSEVRLFDMIVNMPWRDGTTNRLGFPPATFVPRYGSGQPAPQTGPFGGLVVGYAGDYLYKLIKEARRPTAWEAQAKRKLRELADYALENQYGAPGGRAVSGPTATEYGGFSFASNPTTVFSMHVSGCGRLLVQAFDVLGDDKYRDGARMALTCMRRMQCGDLRTSNYSTTTDLGTGRKLLRYWTYVMTPATCAAIPNVFASSVTPVDGATGVCRNFGPVYLQIDFPSLVTLTAWNANGPPVSGVTPALGSSAASFSGTAELALGPDVVDVTATYDRSNGAVPGGCLQSKVWSFTLATCGG